MPSICTICKLKQIINRSDTSVGYSDMYYSCQMHGQCLPVAVDKAHRSFNATLMKHSSVLALRSVLLARDAVMFAHSGLHSWLCDGIYVTNVLGRGFPCKLPEKLDSKREAPPFEGILKVWFWSTCLLGGKGHCKSVPR